MKQIIIIGAGPAGLTCAYTLLKEKKEDYEIIILEESNEIGGISKTVNYNGNRMDIGGHRFFSKNQEVTELWKEILPLQGSNSFDDEKLGRKKPLELNGPNPEEIDEVMLIRTRISRIYYLKKFFDYPLTMKLKTFKNMGIIKIIKASFSYLKTIFVKRKETSLEDFYINRFGKVLYSMFFEKYTEKLWGRHPSDISADWGAQRVKGISIKAIIKDMFTKIFGNKTNTNTETSLIEEFWYPKYGPGQLWETLADKVQKMGAKIYMNHQVINLNFNNDKLCSITCNIKNEGIKIINADYVISSMPMNNLIKGFSGINVPEDIIKIAEGLPFRDFITVGLEVKKLNLKNETTIKTLGNIIPDCWLYIQEPKVKMCRIQIFNNWSPYLVNNAEKNIWLGLEYTCNERDEYWNMSNEEFAKFAINELTLMNIIEKNDVIDYHVEKVKKAYPAYFDTYSQIDKLIDYINKIDNLYCIGRNGQHRYNNMDHSMLTGIETARNIINNKNSKENIWNVNTEKEYHELKK